MSFPFQAVRRASSPDGKVSPSAHSVAWIFGIVLCPATDLLCHLNPELPTPGIVVHTLQRDPNHPRICTSTTAHPAVWCDISRRRPRNVAENPDFSRQRFVDDVVRCHTKRQGEI